MEGERRRREPLEGCGGMFPQEILFEGARKRHFLQFPGDSFIKKNIGN